MKLPQGLTKGGAATSEIWASYRWPIIGLFAVIVLGVVAQVGLDQYQHWQESDRASKEQGALAIHTEAVGEGVASALKVIDKTLGGPRPTMEGDTQDKAAVRAFADSLVTQLIAQPGVIGARFVEYGRRQPDNSSVPRLGYAALDTLRRTEDSGEYQPPEALFFGSESEHIAVIRSIQDSDGTLIGHILIGLDAKFLQPIAERSAGESAGPVYLEVVQLGGSKPVVLAKAGTATMRQGITTATRVIPGTRWRLSMWTTVPDPTSAGGIGDYVVPATGALAVAALAGFAFVYTRRRKQAKPVFAGAAAQADAPEDSAGAAPAAPVVVRDAVDAADDDSLPAFGGGTPPLVEVAELDESAHGLVFEDEKPTGVTEAAGSEIISPALETAPDAGMTMLEVPGSESDASADPFRDQSAASPPASGGGATPGLPDPAVFRAYDVRGIVGEALSVDHVKVLGAAIGSEAHQRGQQTIVVARDGRVSSPDFHAAVIEGLQGSGRDVIDIGMVPTPVLYFATYYLNTGSGVMVTASHNPPEYNGLKVMLGGETLFGDDIAALRTRIESGDLTVGEGSLQEMDLVSEYIRRVSEDVPVALGNAYRIVVDCGNGVAGAVAPKLFRALGHDVVELYCDIDGSFPNHNPDTADPTNLVDLQKAVVANEADLGFAFDGDGDRLAVVDGSGEIVWPDRLMMLYARDILSRNPGAKIVYDVKCSNRLGLIISKLGGIPIMWKTGHSFLKNKLREEGAELAGEMSGHIFFQERWYGFDDAMYAAARLLEILMALKQSPTEILSKLPAGVSTPELRLPLAEGDHLRFMEKFSENVEIADAEISLIDGVRADFTDGWGLVRASNTTPALVFRFEANDADGLSRIQEQFRGLIEGVQPGLALPF